MARYILNIIAITAATLLCGNLAIAQKLPCKTPAIQTDISEKAKEYALQISQEGLSVETVLCDLGKPNSDVILKHNLDTIAAHDALTGERYVTYGDFRTDKPASDNAFIFIVSHDGFVRIMERYTPRTKKVWSVELVQKPGIVAVRFGDYTHKRRSSTP